MASRLRACSSMPVEDTKTPLAPAYSPALGEWTCWLKWMVARTVGFTARVNVSRCILPPPACNTDTPEVTRQLQLWTVACQRCTACLLCMSPMGCLAVVDHSAVSCASMSVQPYQLAAVRAREDSSAERSGEGVQRTAGGHFVCATMSACRRSGSRLAGGGCG